MLVGAGDPYGVPREIVADAERRMLDWRIENIRRIEAGLPPVPEPPPQPRTSLPPNKFPFTKNTMVLIGAGIAAFVIARN